MAHRTIFAILYTPGTKQPVRGRQLDLSVVQKLETTLLACRAYIFSPTGRAPYMANAIPVWEFCPFLCLPVICEIAEIVLFRHSPRQDVVLFASLFFFKLDWFFRGTMRLRHARRAPCLLPSGQWQAQVQRRPCGVGAGARGGGIDPGGHVCVVQCQCAARHRRLQRSVGVRRASKHEREWKKISGRDEQHLQIDIPDSSPYPLKL